MTSGHRHRAHLQTLSGASPSPRRAAQRGRASGSSGGSGSDDAWVARRERDTALGKAILDCTKVLRRIASLEARTALAVLHDLHPALLRFREASAADVRRVLHAMNEALRHAEEGCAEAVERGGADDDDAGVVMSDPLRVTRALLRREISHGPQRLEHAFERFREHADELLEHLGLEPLDAAAP